ncbi:hypothetical protein HYH02_002481 [Chlamydomonas schloesseri]|uniref:RRM domain-containing protein n=1 Tax=Chlamydomonas schloesseri TaxID=2026947 RepID=A0A836BBP9_9CHLO|nr:hypothetical protein HYH02_002481 [Chlamydomonas schloesseri]|eukprot:KAG2453155.1 hypothetical protein HYH02_002481 [Chlamydomonas schloesseri]
MAKSVAGNCAECAAHDHCVACSEVACSSDARGTAECVTYPAPSEALDPALSSDTTPTTLRASNLAAQSDTAAGQALFRNYGALESVSHEDLAADCAPSAVEASRAAAGAATSPGHLQQEIPGSQPFLSAATAPVKFSSSRQDKATVPPEAALTVGPPLPLLVTGILGDGGTSWVDMVEDSERCGEQLLLDAATEMAPGDHAGVGEDQDDSILFDDGNDDDVLAGPAAAAAESERAAAAAAEDAALEADSLLMEACAVGMRGYGGSFSGGGGAYGGRVAALALQQPPPAFGRSSYASRGDTNGGEGGDRLTMTSSSAQHARGQQHLQLHQQPTQQQQQQHGVHPWEVRHLWLGNLLPTTTGAQLERLFAPYGPLESVRVFSDRNFAFVNFMTAQHASTAKAALEGHPAFGITGGRPLLIRYQQQRQQHQQQHAAASTAPAAAFGHSASASSLTQGQMQQSLFGGLMRCEQQQQGDGGRTPTQQQQQQPLGLGLMTLSIPGSSVDEAATGAGCGGDAMIPPATAATAATAGAPAGLLGPNSRASPSSYLASLLGGMGNPAAQQQQQQQQQQGALAGMGTATVGIGDVPAAGAVNPGFGRGSVGIVDAAAQLDAPQQGERSSVSGSLSSIVYCGGGGAADSGASTCVGGIDTGLLEAGSLIGLGAHWTHQQQQSGGLGAAAADDRSLSRNLWLGNLVSNVDRGALEVLFGRFGPLESVRVFPDRNFAFVNYLRASDAAAAKSALDGQPAPPVTPPDRALEVRFQQRPQPQAQQQQLPVQQLLQFGASGGMASGSGTSSACGPPSSMPATNMGSLFGGTTGLLAGELAGPDSSGGSSSVPAVDGVAGAYSCGAGSGSAPFLASAGLGGMAAESEWESAMGGCSVVSGGAAGSGAGGSGAPGSTYALPEGRPNRHLWLGNIPHNVDKVELEALFSRFGPLESVRVFPDRNFCFVNFVLPHHAAAARLALDGQPAPSVTGARPLFVRYQRDQPKTRDGKSGGDGRDAAATAAAAAAAAATLFGGSPGGAAASTAAAAAQGFVGASAEPAGSGARPLSGGSMQLVGGGLGGLPGGLPAMAAEVGPQQKQQQEVAEALAASLSAQTWFAEASSGGILGGTAGSAGGAADLADLAAIQAALSMEPAANLSNMLNPNNIHYGRQLASWYRLLTREAKLALHDLDEGGSGLEPAAAADGSIAAAGDQPPQPPLTLDLFTAQLLDGGGPISMDVSALSVDADAASIEGSRTATRPSIEAASGASRTGPIGGGDVSAPHSSGDVASVAGSSAARPPAQQRLLAQLQQSLSQPGSQGPASGSSLPNLSARHDFLSGASAAATTAAAASGNQAGFFDMLLADGGSTAPHQQQQQGQKGQDLQQLQLQQQRQQQQQQQLSDDLVRMLRTLHLQQNLMQVQQDQVQLQQQLQQQQQQQQAFTTFVPPPAPLLRPMPPQVFHHRNPQLQAQQQAENAARRQQMLLRQQQHAQQQQQQQAAPSSQVVLSPYGVVSTLALGGGGFGGMGFGGGAMDSLQAQMLAQQQQRERLLQQQRQRQQQQHALDGLTGGGAASPGFRNAGSLSRTQQQQRQVQAAGVVGWGMDGAQGLAAPSISGGAMGAFDIGAGHMAFGGEHSAASRPLLATAHRSQLAQANLVQQLRAQQQQQGFEW